MSKKYIDYPQKDVNRIKRLVSLEYFVTDAEVIRAAVSIGLTAIEKEKGISE